MTRAKRKIVDQTAHFALSEDRVGTHVLRFILKCMKCNKEKTFPGGAPHIKHKCCNREYEYDPGAK